MIIHSIKPYKRPPFFVYIIVEKDPIQCCACYAMIKPGEAYGQWEKDSYRMRTWCLDCLERRDAHDLQKEGVRIVKRKLKLMRIKNRINFRQSEVILNYH